MAGGPAGRVAHIPLRPFGTIGIGAPRNCLARSLQPDIRKCKDRKSHRIDRLTSPVANPVPRLFP